MAAYQLFPQQTTHENQEKKTQGNTYIRGCSLAHQA